MKRAAAAFDFLQFPRKLISPSFWPQMSAQTLKVPADTDATMTFGLIEMICLYCAKIMAMTSISGKILYPLPYNLVYKFPWFKQSVNS